MKCDHCDGVGVDAAGNECIVCNGAGDVYRPDCKCFFCCTYRGEEYVEPVRAKRDTEPAPDHDGDTQPNNEKPDAPADALFRITDDDQEAFVVSAAATPAVLSALFSALEANGMRRCTCDCGREFLTRSDSNQCPPCRGIDK